MKLLVFSDIHSDLRALRQLVDTEADYYVAAGDLVNWGRGLDAVGEVLQSRAGRMYVLPGNHESEHQIESFCASFGLHPFHGRSIRVGPYHVAGLGYSSPTPFDTPGEYSEPEMAKHLEPFAPLNPLVLICHCPPKETALDQMTNGGHAGSTSVRDFIDRHQPPYFFCGHIHEAAGYPVKLGATWALNVGKRGFLLDFDKLPV